MIPSSSRRRSSSASASPCSSRRRPTRCGSTSTCDACAAAACTPDENPRIRPVPTLLVGMLGGLLVGITSVGSGSVIMIALLMLYPGLSAVKLVGTDLVQAVPLVLSAAIANILIHGLEWDLLIPLVIGSVPGTIIGARIAPRVPQSYIRRGIVVVLTMSGVALLSRPACTRSARATRRSRRSSSRSSASRCSSWCRSCGACSASRPACRCSARRRSPSSRSCPGRPAKGKQRARERRVCRGRERRRRLRFDRGRARVPAVPLPQGGDRQSPHAGAVPEADGCGVEDDPAPEPRSRAHGERLQLAELVRPEAGGGADLDRLDGVVRELEEEVDLEAVALAQMSHAGSPPRSCAAGAAARRPRFLRGTAPTGAAAQPGQRCGAVAGEAAARGRGRRTPRGAARWHASSPRPGRPGRSRTRPRSTRAST